MEVAALDRGKGKCYKVSGLLPNVKNTSSTGLILVILKSECVHV